MLQSPASHGLAAHHHICGLYYFRPPPAGPFQASASLSYLPQLSLSAHTRIISFSSRTSLTQIFVNPSNETIPELRYTFPLYDGVSVTGFVFTINQTRVIRGVVKGRQEAEQIYNVAVARGQTAGLLERLPDAGDVFTTTIGNIPAGADIAVEITYLEELKHDAEVDGIRFTIPTKLAPRYGSYPGGLLGGSTVQGKGGIEIVIDAEMPTGSAIRTIQSPSHPISVTIGTTSISGSSEASQFSPHKALVTLSLGTAELDRDFILQVVAPDTANPVALLETHPTIPNQRALMATLVPNFRLPPSRPEIVFICDRSGSMDYGSKIPNVKAALQLFLKSLPLGVKFNICSFGSSHSFLFDRSQSYDATTLGEAIQHVDAFSANFGGTEMYAPIEDTFRRRFSDMELDVFLLTDGQIWGQEALIDMVNRYVRESDGKIRVFTLGIGSDISHSLIDSVAAAGNGFSQSVTDKEKMGNKVTRMLKAALSPHVTNYTMEVKYENESAASSDDDQDFEIVERVMDALNLEVAEPNGDSKVGQCSSTPLKKPISLFSTSAGDLADVNSAADDVVDEYSHLPAVSEPTLLQAPFVISPLFRFTRSNIYLLLSPDTIQRTPKSIVLKGMSKNGPLELEIAVATLAEKSEIIHQLAAQKAVNELENGRGWIFHARDATDSKLFKDKYSGRFPDMLEREAIRLGVRFQVGSKWCSFAAVENGQISEDGRGGETDIKEENAIRLHPPKITADSRHPPDTGSMLLQQQQAQLALQQQQQQMYVAQQQLAEKQRHIQQQQRQQQRQFHMLGNSQELHASVVSAPGRVTPSDSGAANHALQDYQMQLSLLEQQRNRRSMMARQEGPGAQTSPGKIQATPATRTPDRATKRARLAPNPSFAVDVDFVLPQSDAILCDFDFDSFLHDGCGDDQCSFDFSTGPLTTETGAPAARSPRKDALERLVSLQGFAGAWAWNEVLLDALALDAGRITLVSRQEDLSGAVGTELLATALVLAFLDMKLTARKDEWELLADKATDWIKSKVRDGPRSVEGYLESARCFFQEPGGGL